MRDKTGRFVTGNSGGPGRPKGSRNRLSEAFLADLHAVWLDGGRAALERVREENPVAFLRIVVSVLPREIEAAPGNPLDHWSDDELETFLDHARAVVSEEEDQAA